MRFLRHFVATKGPVHAVERTAEVVRRFTFGARRFDRTMDLLLEDFAAAGARATFFVTAGYIHRHRDRIRRLRDGGHEIASHGLYHSRMDLLDRERQLGILQDSHRRLSEAGFEVTGFRAPYLHFDGRTEEALQESPFGWTSLDLVFWNHGTLEVAEVQRLKGLYHVSTADGRLSLPAFRGRVVEIPVTAPDDEILVERCRVADPQAIYGIWEQVFGRVTGQGELYHLLFHPERYRFCREAIQGLTRLAAGQGDRVWRATLGEVADWWRRRSRWRLYREGSGIRAEAPADAWFSDAAPWLTGREGTVWCFRREVPRVWLVPEADRRLEGFLHQEGFLVERSSEPGPGVVLGRRELEPGGEREILAELERADPRLPRLQRWPQPYTAAMSISADICAIDLRDFLDRAWNF